MSALDSKSAIADGYPVIQDDEEALNLHRDWTNEEEAKAKRK